MTGEVALFELEPEAAEWVPINLQGSELVTLLRALGGPRCRDCGTRSKLNQGGARDAGVFYLCDDCAALDGARVSSHTTVVEDREPRNPWPGAPREAAHCQECGWFVDAARRSEDDPRVLIPLTADDVVDLCAEHERPRYRSRWGVAFELGEFEGRVAAREARRVAYRKRVA